MSRPVMDTQYELDGDPSDHRDALEGPPAKRRWGSRFLAFVVAAAAIYGAVRGLQRYSATSEELNELAAIADSTVTKKPSKDDLGGVNPESVVADWTARTSQRIAADKVHLWSAYGLLLLCPVGLCCSAVIWWRGQFKRPQGAAVLDPVQLSVAMSSVVMLAAVRGFDTYTLMSIDKMPPPMDLRTAFHEVRESKKPERFAILKEKFNSYVGNIKDKSLKQPMRVEAARRLHAIVSRKEFPDVCPDGERKVIVETLRGLIRENYADDTLCTLLVRSVGETGALTDMAALTAEREKSKASWVDVKSEAALRCLHAAITGGDEASVRQLIQRGIALNMVIPGQGRTALHQAVAQKDLKMARLLLEGKARADVAGRYGMPRAIREFPLHRAVAAGEPQMVKLLLDYRANPNVPDDGGMTPLHRAAATGDVEAAKLLIARGAQINKFDKGGRTPFDVAQEVCAIDKRPPIRDLLEKHGGLAAIKVPAAGRTNRVATTLRD